MADLSQHGGYDESAEPSQFDRIPAGTYQAQIVETDIPEISENDDKGKCVLLVWKIMGGNFNDRLIWQRINLYARNMNNLDKVIEIANAQFAAVRQATGKVHVKNTDELLSIPCLITTGPQKKNPQYDEVKAVRPLEGHGAQQRSQPNVNGAGASKQQAGTSQQSRSTGSSNGSSAPWPRR